jgi:hypothetical protein
MRLVAEWIGGWALWTISRVIKLRRKEPKTRKLALAFE